ncbi:hypothetical protein D9613_011588 [Agrocybe pediades]|uniref:Uncharacterized protein n=1 Tax=Agrocybe pediades TaxID=84607 RepID=A0A8H4QXX8_9AGAR|nr:hypothetical protein D9613_011588 [Agrocybe pediades]
MSSVHNQIHRPLLHQTCILKPQGLKLKYKDASSTAIRLIVANTTATALSSSQFHILGLRLMHRYTIHLVRSRLPPPAQEVQMHELPAPRHPLLSFAQFWDTASASPHSTRPNRERAYLPSRDTRMLNAMRGQSSNPNALTET